MSTSPRDQETEEIPDDIEASLPIVPQTKTQSNLINLTDSNINQFSPTEPITTIMKETETTAFGFSDDFTLDTPLR